MTNINIRRIIILVISFMMFFTVEGQWQNFSKSITRSLKSIKTIDSTIFLMGSHFIYKSNDGAKTISLIRQDTVDFDDVINNKDTFYILGHSYLDIYNNAEHFVCKLFPGKQTTDTNWFNIKRGTHGFFRAANYNDSVVMFNMFYDSRPSSYSYNIIVMLSRTSGFFYGAGGYLNQYFQRDSFTLNNYYIKDSSLFILCNYQPISNKTQTILARRNLNKKISNYTQYDSIINLPRAKALYMFNDSAGIIIGDTYIAKSNNYTTWNIKYNCSNCNFKQVWFTSKDTGYVVGSKNGKALILKSMDGGISWREQVCPVTAPLNDIKFTDDGKIGLIVGDSGTILRTENGGGNNFVGINSMQTENLNFQLYPNPATNQLTIVNNYSLINSTYFIYSLQGQILQKGSISENKTTINISKLEPGCYFMNIDGVSQKFIKE